MFPFTRHRLSKFAVLTFIALSTAALIWAVPFLSLNPEQRVTAQTPVAQTSVAQTAAPQAAPSAPKNAGVYRFKVGGFNAATISDGILELPPTAVVPITAPPDVAAALRDEFLPEDLFVGYTNILYLDTGRQKVLIDTGAGNNYLPTLGALKDNLTAAGIDPATIDTVILSHAHLDHVGGIADQNGALTFPNARYYISQKEWDFWTDPSVSLPLFRMNEEMKQGTIAAAKKFLGLIEGRVQFFQPGQEVIPGITAVDVAGHTPGQSAFLIKSDAAELMVTADVFFSDPLNLEHPDWEVVFDTDPAQAVATRKRVLQQVTASRQEVLAYHMPFPGLGHVRSEDNHYEWKPTLWDFEP
jgi:glyoxylase-like metal-dependent hydrolase (beta-lactamase superfamily II)